MSCAVLTNAPKTKKGRLNAPNTPMWFIKIKYESKTIMKYTEDDKPLWNILMVSSKDNGALLNYDQENH
jgi:hypothetical protein